MVTYAVVEWDFWRTILFSMNAWDASIEVCGVWRLAFCLVYWQESPAWNGNVERNVDEVEIELSWNGVGQDVARKWARGGLVVERGRLAVLESFLPFKGLAHNSGPAGQKVQGMGAASASSSCCCRCR